MGYGFKKDTGGVNPLNFKVVGGTTAPSNPKENMIWINTDQKITSWAFSANEPADPVEGMAWIKINDSAGIEIDLVKKNIAAIRIVSAKQYLDDAWAEKPVTVWQNGDWRSSCLWVFNYGKLDYSWARTGKEAYDGSGMGSSAPTETINDDGSVTFRQTVSGISCGIAYITEPFDLTDYTTLEFDANVVSTYAGMDSFTGLSVWSEIGKYIGSNRVVPGVGSHDSIRTVDISAMDGSYYIGVGVCQKDAAVTVRTIRLFSEQRTPEQELLAEYETLIDELYTEVTA